MDHRKIRKSLEPPANPGLEEKYIRQFENQVGVQLPVDLRQLYRIVNGGYFKHPEFECNGEQYVLHGLFALRESDCANDLSVEGVYMDFCVRRKLLRRSLIPFASDEGGSLFCVSVLKRDNGAVYFVTDEEMLSGLPYRKVASSLKEILNSLIG